MKRKSLITLAVASFLILGIFVIPRVESKKYDLTIITEPSECNIKIGDRTINSGDTGEISIVLEEGEKQITVSKPGWDAKTVELDLIKDMTFTISLKRTYHTLTVKTNPSDCKVTINDETITSESYIARFTLPEATYQVSVEKEGYYPLSQKVNLSSGRTILMSLELITYNLTVTTEPKIANIILEAPSGRLSEKTTSGYKKFMDLKTGEYTLTVNKERYLEVQQSISISRNEEINIVLEQIICTLVVKTTPLGCNVAVENHGTKISTINGAVWEDLDKGTYEITASKEGYHSDTKTVTLDEDKIVEMELDPPYLEIISPTGEIDSSFFTDDDIGGNIYFLKIKGNYNPGKNKIDTIKAHIDGIEDNRPCMNPSSTWSKDVKLFGDVKPGKHTLVIKGYYNDKLIETIEQEIELPEYIDFYYTTVGKSNGDIDRGESEDWWLGMEPPLEGRMRKISGRVKMSLLGNPGDCEVWVDLYNPFFDKWQDAVYTFNPMQGWNDIEITFPDEMKYYTDWWGFAGCHWYNDVHRAYHMPLEFEGEITWKVGSWINPSATTQSVNDNMPLSITAHNCDYTTQLPYSKPKTTSTPGFELILLITAIAVAYIFHRKKYTQM